MKKIFICIFVIILLSTGYVQANNEINFINENNNTNSQNLLQNEKEEKSINNNTSNNQSDNNAIKDKNKQNNTINSTQSNNIIDENLSIKNNSLSITSEKTTTETKKTLEDGIYIIKSSINSNYVVNVAGASKTSGANVQINLNQSLENQRFKVEHLSDGYYIITAVHSNMVLDVANAGKAAGTNVWQCYRNNADAQKWLIQDAGDGYYYIISKCNGLYLDVANGVAGNGVNISTCYGNKSKAQKFKFEKYEKKIPQKTIENGTYIIKSSINSNYVVNVAGSSKTSGANVQINLNQSLENQRFKVEYLSDGYYIITALHSNMVLDVANAGKTAGTNVWQCYRNNADAQKWLIQDAGDGYYYIISKCNGLYLDVANGVAGNGVNISTCYGNKSKAQKFKFEKYEKKIPQKTIENGTYVIKSSINEKYSLSVNCGLNTSGANVQIDRNLLFKNQQFKVEYLSDGYYIITAVHSNMVLDVANAGKTAGTNVWQCYRNNADAQKWLIQDAGAGYYYIISKCNGLYLDVANGIAGNGVNISTCYGNKSKAQKFKFEKAEVNNNGIEHYEGVYGTTGLMVSKQGGNYQKYYKWGNGENVFFATFAIHGWEDLWSKDGEELITIAQDFYYELVKKADTNLAKKWTIYVFPGINIDGITNGYTHNGPGRTTLYSDAPGHRGIDLNRCWQIGNSYQRYEDSRNYNGTAGFQAFEAANLRDFLLSKKSKKGQTILVDLHGWTQQLIGDSQICSYYQKQFPENNTDSIGRYGTGYLINWARTNLGSNGKAAKSALIELPNYGNTVNGHQSVLNHNFSNRYIKSTFDMLYSM